MDYRCPICRTDLASRKLIGSIIARMEIDCGQCHARLRLNLHPLESRIVYASFGSFAALGALGYVLHKDTLYLFALAAGMAGPTALPVLERTYLKNWARYVPAGSNPGGNPF